MKLSAADSDRNTAGRVRPSRSRITTTTWRLPFWFLANLRSRRISLWLASFTYTPKYPPSASTVRSAPPIRTPLSSLAIASRGLRTMTKAILYWTYRSRLSGAEVEDRAAKSGPMRLLAHSAGKVE